MTYTEVAAALQAFPFESIAGLAVFAGTLVLVFLIVAFGAFVYRSVVGDGIRWPDEETDDDGVRRTDADDEWKYH